MAINAAQLSVDIDATTTGLDRGIDESNNKLSSLGSAVKNFAVGLGVGAGAATVFGIKSAAATENSRIGFQTMLGSVDEGNKRLGELRDFAASTPFEFPELRTAASSLLSVGVKADNVIPIMRNLGNATAGMGTGSEGIKRATVAIQQMNAAGRISAEDLNQLRDAGVPVFEVLTKATGKTTEQIAAMAQSGKLGRKELDQLNAALVSGKGFEKFGGLMEKQSVTLNGAISTLKDTVTNSASDLFEPYLPAMAAGIIKLSAALQSNLPKVQMYFGLLVSGLDSARMAFHYGETSGVGGFTGALETVAVAIRKVKDGFAQSGLEGAISALGTSASANGPALVSTFKDLVAGLKDAAKEAPPAKDVMTVFAGAIKLLSDNMDTFVKYAPFLVAAFVAFKAATAASTLAIWPNVAANAALAVSNYALSRSMKGVSAASAESSAAIAGSEATKKASILSTIGAQVTATARVVGGWLVQSATAVASAARQAGAWALTKLSALSTIPTMAVAVASVVAGWVVMGVQSLLGAAKVALSWLIAMGPIGLIIAAVIGLVAIIIANWDTITRVTGELWANFQVGVQVLWDWVKAAFQSAVDFLVNLFMTWSLPGIIIGHWDLIKTKTSEAFTAVKAFIGDAVAWVVDKFMRFTGPGLLISHWDTIKTKTSEAFNAVKTFVADAISKIVDTITGIPGKIGNLGASLYQKGVDIIQGLLNGMGSLLGKIGSFMADKLPAVLQGPFKKALGIASPSKVFAQLGRAIPDGLVQGIKQGSSLVDGALTSLGNGLSASGSVAFSGATSSGSSSGSVTISEGAVQINVDGSNLSEQQLTRVAESAIRELVREVAVR